MSRDYSRQVRNLTPDDAVALAVVSGAGSRGILLSCGGLPCNGIVTADRVERLGARVVVTGVCEVGEGGDEIVTMAPRLTDIQIDGLRDLAKKRGARLGSTTVARLHDYGYAAGRGALLEITARGRARLEVL